MMANVEKKFLKECTNQIYFSEEIHFPTEKALET